MAIIPHKLQGLLAQIGYSATPLSAWVASTAEAVGFEVLDSNGNIQKVTTAGATGAAVPAWNAVVGGTTTDGTVTWTNEGPVPQFAALQNFDLTIKADEIDASDHDSQGWKNKLPGLKEWSGTAKKLYVEGGQSDADILAAITGDTLLYFTFYPEVATAGSGERSYTGQGYITNFKHAGQNNDCQAIDITIAGDGPLAKTPQ